MLESDFLLTQLHVPRRMESTAAPLSKP